MQVRPPGDTINDIVRDLAQLANITNAAILHDDSFGRRTLQIENHVCISCVKQLSVPGEITRLHSMKITGLTFEYYHMVYLTFDEQFCYVYINYFYV